MCKSHASLRTQISRMFCSALLFSVSQAMSRPCYSSIITHATQHRPALVFAPTRKHARMTAMDLLSFAAADGNQLWWVSPKPSNPKTLKHQTLKPPNP